MEGKVVPPVEPINVNPPMSAAKSNKWLIPVLGFFSALLVAVIAVLAYQNFLLRKASTSAPSSLSSKEMTPSPGTTTPSASEESKTVSLDEIWNLYTNNKYGFSIKFPKKSTGAAPCVWSTEGGDHSYRPKSGPVPVTVFEKNLVYLTQEFTYKLTGEQKEGSRSYFSGCDKQTISLANVQDEFIGWQIEIKTIDSDEELTAFIQSTYGQGCGLGQKKLSTQEGVFDVEVPSDQSTCFMNFRYVLKYSPEKKMLYSWGLGQDISFSLDNVPYDEEMVKSFKVL
jgi:hypothetical protein